MKLLRTKGLVGTAAGAVLAMFASSACAGEDVSIAIPSKSMVSARLLIADELGLFDRHDLVPNFVYLDASANTAASALVSGAVEVAVVTPSDAINVQLRGQDMVLIGNNYAGLSGSLVLSKAVADRLGVSPTAPVAERLKALDGLAIASTNRASNLTTAYGGSAGAAGATPRFTYMAIAAMTAALESGAVDGFVATAPIWTGPVLNGSGVLWISAPKGELPPQFTPAASAVIAVMRGFAEANPGLVAAVAAVNEDLSKAVEERPEAVKAAVAKLFPALDAETLDLVFAMEARAMAAKPLTVDAIAHEIELLRLNGVLPDDPGLDPAALLWSEPS